MPREAPVTSAVFPESLVMDQSFEISELLLAELRPCSGNKLRIRVRVTGEAPAAVGSLGKQHPDPLLHRRVARRRSNNARQLGDHLELLLTIQTPGIRKHLDPDAGGLSVDIRQAVRTELLHVR